MDKLLESIWSDHCYDGFPRRIGTPVSYVIDTEREFLDEIWKYVGYLDMYAGVYSEEVKDAALINKLYIDLDCQIDKSKPFTNDIRISKVAEVHALMTILVKCIRDSLHTVPRVYFSGNKGFNIYIDLKEPYKVKHNFSFIGKRFIQKLLVASRLRKDCLLEEFDEFDYGFIDPSVLGQFTRISRLPYTKHIKSNLLCYPIDWKINHKSILRAATSSQPRMIERNLFDEEFNYFLQGIDDEYPEYYEITKEKWKHVNDPKTTLEEDLQVFMSLAPHITDGRRRIIHAMIIPRLVVGGKSKEEIRSFCKQFIEATNQTFNYDWESYVKYQSDYRRNKGTIPWSWGAFFNKYPDLMRVFKQAEVKSNES